MKWFVVSLICYGVVAAQHQPPFLAFQQQIPQQVPSSSNVRFPAEPHWQFRSGIPQNVQWSEPQEFLHAQSQPQQFQQFQQFQQLQPQVQQRIPQQVHQQQTRSAQEFRPQPTRSSQQFQSQPKPFQPQKQFQQFRNVPVTAPVVPPTQQQVIFRTEPVPVVRQPVPVTEPVLAPVQGQSQNHVPQREVPAFTTIRHVASTEAQAPHIFAPVQHLNRKPIVVPVTEIVTEPEPETEEVHQEIHTENLRGKPTRLPEAPAIIHAVFAEPTTMVPFEPEAEEISTEETVDDRTTEEIVDSTVQPLEAVASTNAPSTTTTTTEATTTTTTTEPTTTTEATTTTTVATSSRRSYSSKKSGFKPRTTTTEKPELNSLPTRTPNSAFSRSSGGGYKSNCGCVRMLACQRLQISINRCNESEGFMYCCGSKDIKDEPEVKEAKAKALEEVPTSTTAASATSTTETVAETEAVEVATEVSQEA